MFGPARRPSKRLRTPLIAAALGAAALAAPAASLAATVGEFDGTIPTECTRSGEGVYPVVATTAKIHLTLTDSDHDAPVTRDALFATGTASLPLDVVAAATIGTASGATSESTIERPRTFVGISGVTGTSLELHNDTPAPFGPGTVNLSAGLTPIGTITAAGGSSLGLTSGSFTFVVSTPAPGGGAVQVFWNCAPTGPASFGSLPVGTAPPSISGLSSTSGANTGGDTIIVVGFFPSAVNAVDFGGVAARSQKIDDRQLSVTVPALPSGSPSAGVRIRVKSDIGESPATPGDLFDYTDPSDPSQVTGTFTSQCLMPGITGSTVFDVTTKVRLKAQPLTAAGLQVASTASTQLDAAAVKRLFTQGRLRVTRAALSTGPLTLGVAGTSIASIAAGDGAGASGPILTSTDDGLPISFSAPTVGFGGVVSAGIPVPGGTRVTFTGRAFTFSSYVNSYDSLDGLTILPYAQNYTCTPVGDATVGSLEVGDGPEPVSTSVFYGAAGTATLKNLVKGSLPLTGSLSGEFDPAGAFAGNLSLAQGTAKLTALGILPVVAKVALVQTAPLTGTQSGSSFSGTAKVRVKVPSASVFGVQLGGGANCQATQVSTIPLKSTGSFTPAAGGTLTGTFSISNLSGCGALNGIVSSLTAGSGNSLALALAPAPKS